MRGKKKSLDDFFAKKDRSHKQTREMCDLSLCSATTKKESSPAMLCTWKQNPNAFKLVPQRIGSHRVGSLSTLSELGPMRQDLLVLTEKDQSTSLVKEITTSSLGGVTFGIGQLLYNQRLGATRDNGIEERTDVEILDSDSVINGSVTVIHHEDDEQSIEVSMSGFEFTTDDRTSVSSLGRKGARMMEEAKLAEEKVRNEEHKIAAQRRLLEVEHSEFQSILMEFRKEAHLAAKRRKEEEARLAERRRILKEAYLKEQARLLEEEERLMEESRKAAVSTRRILEEARLADLNTSFEEQISRSLSHVYTLGVLSETTWEHDEDSKESGCNEADAYIAEEKKALEKHHWKELDGSEFKVRGRNYLLDKRKIPSSPNLFRLITVDMVEVSKPIMTGFCSHPNERVQVWLRQEKIEDKNIVMPEFVFCVNMILPGPPYYHLVMYFGINNLAKLGLQRGCKQQTYSKPLQPYSKPLQQFLFGDSDAFRNKALKFIPHVKEGSFLLKTAVGTKPFILGNYLDVKFIKDENERYLEVIADVGSSSTFQKLMKLSSNYNSTIVGAMAFLLEASDEASLPENVMCSVELTNQNFEGQIRFVEDLS